MILGFTLISKRFQSPRHVINAKYPRLALINVAVPNFLLTKSPPIGTQDAQLPTPLVTKLLYSQKPPIPSNDEVQEPIPEPVQEVTDRDFEVFYQQ